MEVIHLAALAAGPLGMNPLGELAHDYFLEWADDGAGSGLEWPDGWSPDVERFRSGIDLGSDGVADGELELLREWNRRMYGEVPPSVEFAAQAELPPTRRSRRGSRRP